MTRAGIAVAVGVILLLVGFATGTAQPSASPPGASFSCDPAIDLNRLPFNELGTSPVPAARTSTPEARREEAACRDATTPLRLVTWTALAVGSMVALAGWTALREASTPGAGSSKSRLPA